MLRLVKQEHGLLESPFLATYMYIPLEIQHCFKPNDTGYRTYTTRQTSDCVTRYIHYIPTVRIYRGPKIAQRARHLLPKPKHDISSHGFGIESHKKHFKILIIFLSLFALNFHV